MQNHNEPIVIKLGNKTYSLIPVDFQDQIDLKEFLTIDVGNITGELLTFPMVMNQISNLKAETDQMVSDQKMVVNILRSNLEKEYKMSRQQSGLKTTNADVESYIYLHEAYQEAERQLIIFQKNSNIMNGFYWSAQSKMDALMKISDKISPEEFNTEVLEKSVNNVLVKRVRV